MHTVSLFSAQEAADLRSQAQKMEFVDGKTTATGTAKEAKRNLQARRHGDEYAEFVSTVLSAVAKNRIVRNVAFPRRFSQPLVNRYEAGGTYGLHVDRAFMGGTDGIRTDLSFTLFLTPPDDYEGGVLQIAGESGMSTIKGDAGSLVLYSTSALHQVTPITAGARLSVVGWIESWLPDPRYRELMTKLKQVEAVMEESKMPTMTRLLMSEVTEGLLRYGAR